MSQKRKREEKCEVNEEHKYMENSIRPVTQRFVLNKSTKEIILSMKPRFGYNGLGEVVFRRTYSRNNESWHDVVIRVIEGVLTIRKEHFYRNSLGWKDDEWQSFAKEMALSLFEMEWLPPGRGLWMMGTDFVYERGSMGLFNCGATDTKDDLVLSAEWTMDCLMNGVGIGFNTDWKGVAEIPDKKDSQLFVVPDSREGWCESLVKLLCSYINSPRYGKNKFPIFDYSQIRQQGLPIKGFGGLASGPEPLRKMHTRIEGYLDNFCQGFIEVDGKKKSYTHVRLIADIFNSIGACVVAG
jgi:ribonucleoside-triphosphate reductase